ncbi:MAG: hypothetical protein IKE43_09545 [Coriobacteriales bacterium]|nr:hypothetical protein [Coriobacteriales bacterium]
MTSGKGFADVVYIPLKQTDPALIIELKRNGSTQSALDQIIQKRYFDSLDQYTGNLLFVGINYDEKTKNPFLPNREVHQTIICATQCIRSLKRTSLQNEQSSVPCSWSISMSELKPDALQVLTSASMSRSKIRRASRQKTG